MQQNINGPLICVNSLWGERGGGSKKYLMRLQAGVGRGGVEKISDETSGGGGTGGRGS